MAIFGTVFAFIGRQAGKVLNIALGWATIALFGRVPKDRQPFLSAMAGAALAWPIVLVGLAFPSVGTFLLAFITLPHWAEPWVRPVMIALAVLLPLAVGFLSTRVITPAPKGGELAKTIVRGYVFTPALFVVFVWMMVLAPTNRVRALVKRWQAEHIAVAIKPRGYDTVVDDVVAALARAGIAVSVRPAGRAWTLPGRILAVASGRDITSLVPDREVVLHGDRLEIAVHPMDLAARGAKIQLAHARSAITRELTFTQAYQTWTKEAQQIEDALREASAGRRDVETVRRRIFDAVLERDEWAVLYRLLLQVELLLAAPQRERAAAQGRGDGIVDRARDALGAAVAAVRPPGPRDRAVEVFVVAVDRPLVHYLRRETALKDGASAAAVARATAERELQQRVGAGAVRATGTRTAGGRQILTYCVVSDSLDRERARPLDLAELEKLMRSAAPTDEPTEVEVLWHALREVGAAA